MVLFGEVQELKPCWRKYATEGEALRVHNFTLFPIHSLCLMFVGELLSLSFMRLLPHPPPLDTPPTLFPCLPTMMTSSLWRHKPKLTLSFFKVPLLRLYFFHSNRKIINRLWGCADLQAVTIWMWQYMSNSSSTPAAWSETRDSAGVPRPGILQ